MKLSDRFHWISSASSSEKVKFKKILKTHETVVWEIIFGIVFPICFIFFKISINERNGSVDRREAFKCWKSSALKQTSSFIKMSQCRENKPRRGREMFLKYDFTSMFYFTETAWRWWIRANLIYCWIISHPAEICPHEATSLIHWPKQQDQLCRHNKPYSWHSLCGEDLFSSACQQLSILVSGFAYLIS